MKWNWIGVVLGAWLIAAPFALGYRGTSLLATGEAVILGIIIAGCSLWVVLKLKAPAAISWLVMLFGLWVVIAPFVLGYRSITLAFVNDIVVGILVLVLALTQVMLRARRPKAVS
jgi:hypothetical protein